MRPCNGARLAQASAARPLQRAAVVVIGRCGHLFCCHLRLLLLSRAGWLAAGWPERGAAIRAAPRSVPPERRRSAAAAEAGNVNLCAGAPLAGLVSPPRKLPQWTATGGRGEGANDDTQTSSRASDVVCASDRVGRRRRRAAAAAAAVAAARGECWPGPARLAHTQPARMGANADDIRRRRATRCPLVCVAAGATRLRSHSVRGNSYNYARKRWPGSHNRRSGGWPAAAGSRQQCDGRPAGRAQSASPHTSAPPPRRQKTNPGRRQ
jgi:hypothetical protein